MAESLGLAASVIAVVQLSYEVIKLGALHAIKVKHSKNDILQLQRGITLLFQTSNNVKRLLDGPYRNELEALSSLNDAFIGADILLKRLQQELDPNVKPSGWTWLRWPFQSSRLESKVEEVGSIIDAISHASNIRHAY